MTTPIEDEDVVPEEAPKEEKKPLKLFSHLSKEVKLGMCRNCGACVAACPTDAIEMIDGKINLKGKCIACGICYEQCQHMANNWDLAEKVFGRKPKTDGIGIYSESYSAKSRSPDVQAVGHDGGTITEILSVLLDVGYIDGAVVMGIGDAPWLPWPMVARTRRDVMEGAGSKYAPGPALLGLRDAVELYSCEQLAIVGLPCQIKAIRRMQTSEMAAPHGTDPIKLTIGLFCTKVFPYEEFYKRIVEDELNIGLGEVAKFDISKGNFIIYRKSKPKREIAVESLGKYACEHCRVCLDFAAELADISIGSVGSPGGRTTVLLRTEVGKEAFTQARRGQHLHAVPLKSVKPGIGLVKKLSAKKKRISMAEINRRRKKGQPLPLWLREESD